MRWLDPPYWSLLQEKTADGRPGIRAYWNGRAIKTVFNDRGEAIQHLKDLEAFKIYPEYEAE